MHAVVHLTVSHLRVYRTVYDIHIPDKVRFMSITDKVRYIRITDFVYNGQKNAGPNWYVIREVYCISIYYQVYFSLP